MVDEIIPYITRVGIHPLYTPPKTNMEPKNDGFS